MSYISIIVFTLKIFHQKWYVHLNDFLDLLNFVFYFFTYNTIQMEFIGMSVRHI